MDDVSVISLVARRTLDSTILNLLDEVSLGMQQKCVRAMRHRIHDALFSSPLALNRLLFPCGCPFTLSFFA